MTIRTLHHTAATGGTLITRCIANLDSICLLNEINPMAPLFPAHIFEPLNLVSQLIRSYPDLAAPLRSEHFHNQLEIALKVCRSKRQTLVIRDHAHSDYMIDEPRPSSLLSLLASHARLSLVTIRDPIDSFLSCKKNNWVSSLDFNAYCERQLRFMDDFATIPCLKYEDFCDEPVASMKRICSILSLDYQKECLNKVPAIKFSGGSGRVSDTIERRPRRPIPPGDEDMIRSSTLYREFCQRFGYPSP